MEIWKDIPGWEALYEISSFGRVRSKDKVRDGVTPKGKPCKRFIKGQMLKPVKKNKDGYLGVNLYEPGRLSTYYIHRLVGLCFIPNDLELPEIDHIDRDKTNNHFTNLRWVSAKENSSNRKPRELKKTLAK